ncbi:MAG: hypothetical protein ACTSSJ_04970 [Candidatus Odinarchaeia archaeon]
MGECGSKCSARSLIEEEFENFIKNNFKLKIIPVQNVPKEYLAKIRFESEKGGVRRLICRYANGKKTDDIAQCMRELAPKKILKFRGVFYLT